jgi:hypothetical protein
MGVKLRHCIKRMGRITRIALLGIGLTVLGSSANAQGIRMSIQQVWSGLEPSQSNPYYANIDNSGPNTNGIISTDSVRSKVSIEYPVELPSGSKKRVLFLSGTYSDGKVTLRSSAGIKEATIKGSYSSEQTRYGLISDNPSDLIFLKGQTGSGPDPSGNAAIGIGGCVPDDAPDRSFGYNCLDAVVLGDGTEKLRDDQISAIKLYVQSGGSLVFVGGAAKSASSDVRWRELLPILNPTVVTKNGLTETVGKVRPGSISTKVSKGTCLGRSFGAGIVSIVSVNPFESPIRESEDRRSIMSRAVRWNHKQSFRNLVNRQIGQQESQNYYAAPAAVAYAPGYAPTPMSPLPGRFSATNADPFQIKPPSLNNILWILVCYALAVVPINFLILRKLKKMEIAWISTPVISVVFSFILLNSTIGLYRANATTRTTSIAILGQSVDDAVIFGRSEMFFPQAKSYDLELSNVESVLTADSYSETDKGGLSLQDDGRHLVAPDVRTANLAFKELGYVQTSSELKGLSMTLVSRNGQLFVNVVNNSRANITGISLCGVGKQQSISAPVNSGQSAMLPVSTIVNSKPDPKRPDEINGWQRLASTSPNKIVVLASVDSMKVGPKYGAGHPGSQYMVVAVPQWGDLP